MKFKKSLNALHTLYENNLLDKEEKERVQINNNQESSQEVSMKL